MKQLIVVFVGVLLLTVIGCQAGNTGDTTAADTDQKVALDSDKAKVSYAIGYNMGRNIRNIIDEMDLAVLFQGIRDGSVEGNEAQMTAEEMQAALTGFQTKVRELMQKKRDETGKKNEVEGKAFLEENAKKESVVTTKSGLQYKVLREGDGPMPKATDTVKAHYEGRFIDGTVFQSSYKTGKPFVSPVNRVIPGWIEGLQLMKVGSKYTFYIPANLAYGAQGRGNAIGPNSVLIFDLELLSIEPPAEKKPQPKAQPKTQKPQTK